LTLKVVSIQVTYVLRGLAQSPHMCYHAWCSHPFNAKHTKHPPSQCTYPHSDAELGQAALEVKNLTLTETEALQHL